MSKTINDFPAISGSNNRKPVPISYEDLKNVNIAFASYGFQKDDEVTFPSSVDDLVVVEQPIRVNSTAKQVLVGVERKGKPGWLSVGSLARQDVDRKYTCDFTEEMGKLENAQARIDALMGKTVKCTGMKEVELPDFTPEGQLKRDESGNTVRRPGQLPIIDYVRQ